MKSRKKILKMRQHWQIYLLLLLPIAYLLIFSYQPMFGQIIAFKDFKVGDTIFSAKWVGLANFREFFQSYKFGLVLRNTLTVSIYSFIASFPIPILFALMLNALPGHRFKKIIQGTAFAPYFISVVVIVGLLNKILDYRSGLYGAISVAFTGEYAQNLFSKGNWFKHLYVWSGIWQSLGYNTVVYTAALSGVDQELHDAAIIDGASRFQRVRYIDWQTIRPTVVIMTILSLGHIMGVGYEKVLLMQNNINMNYSEVISTYVYKIGLASGLGNFSFSTAVGMFNSVINLVMLLISNLIAKKLTGESIF